MQIEPAQWEKIQAHWEEHLDATGYRSWLAPLLPTESPTSATVTVAAPTRFMRDWVAKHYADIIREGINSVLNIDETVQVEFVVATASAPQVETFDLPTPDATNASPVTAVTPRYGTPLDSRFTFNNFVTGKSNEFAFAAAQRVAANDEMTYNPFVMHGGVGLGKTHLMQAIAHQIRQQNPTKRVLYLSAEKFLFSFIKALRDRNTLAFKDQFRDIDVLMIDDIQFIAGKEATQEEFFHTFNALVDMGKQVILTSDRSPHDLPGLADRLRSRLGSGLTVELHAPDTETRLNILAGKAQQLGLNLPRDVAMLLAEKIHSNVRELVGALNRLAAHAELVGAEITPDFAKEQLQDLLRAYARVITIDDIQRTVADYYHLKLADLHGVRRTRAVARPRQVAMFLCKQLTTRSYPEIGRCFGGRDHTTVIHAVRNIEKLSNDDSQLREDVEMLTRMLKN